MFGADSSYSFVDYARMQHDLGAELAARHVPELTGCCRACGRVFPCDGYVDGQYMQVHYLSYLPEFATTDLTSADLAATDLAATDLAATDLAAADLAAGAIRSTETPLPQRVFVSAFNRMA